MKLRDKLNLRYRWGWRAYRKRDLKLPPIEIALSHPELVIEEEDNLIFIRDKKFWEK